MSRRALSQYSLPVTILKEGKYYIAHSPVLDLSTSGKSVSEVKRRFEEVVHLFFEEIEEKGTLDKVLSELGWQKIEKHWTPPQLISYGSTSVRLPLSS